MMPEIAGQLYDLNSRILFGQCECDIQNIVRAAVVHENKLVVKRELVKLVKDATVKLFQIGSGIIKRRYDAQLAVARRSMVRLGLLFQFKGGGGGAHRVYLNTIAQRNRRGAQPADETLGWEKHRD